MSRRRPQEKKMQKTIASQRISYLFALAELCAREGKLALANRYVELARKISMKYLVPIPVEFKRRFCTHCYQYLLPATTCRVRIHRGMIITYCHSCKKYSRMPLHHRKSSKSNS